MPSISCQTKLIRIGLLFSAAKRTSAILTISPQTVAAFDTQSKLALGREFSGYLQSIGLPVPPPADWQPWWDATWDSGAAWGATQKQTLFLHALLRSFHGPDYLGLPDLDWQADLLTEGGAHEPVYHLAEDVWPDVIQVVRDVYITDVAGPAQWH